MKALARWWRNGSNCLIEALRMMRAHDGYLIVRLSRQLIAIPHFMWMPKKSIESHPELKSFVPLEPGDRRLPKPSDFLFEGATKSCDLPVCTRELPQCGQCEWGNRTRQRSS